MPSLRERQQALQEAILAGGATGGEGLDIYRHAYRARLAGALGHNYPVLARRMGEAEFGRLADRYAREHPSSHFNIRWHGASLWRLLADAHADLARMEWALGCAFDAPDATPLAWDELRRMPLERWAQMPLALHPSTQIVALSWAVEGLWEGAAAVHPHRHALLVWRKGSQAHWRIAEDGEAQALRSLDALGTLDAACDALPRACAANVGPWLAGWVRESMLASGGSPG